ncbi:nitrite/sulfite reductase [Luminiphilus sp.]|nr:nitrite/sulfite reductase [Luminiphilus sp.]MDC0507135.1 nitrite/sulfite reductase [Luminiphilus sp.]MDC0972971.1 nitrite/sulfite reductase [Luminiphilus sp.]
MYAYSEFDRAFVRDRVSQYRDQVKRRLNGSLTEDEFKPLRLMNGVYLQLHAYMLRVAIPYGSLTPRQMRQLADVADRWDKGYGHFTTRQNIQFNWPRLIDTPEILEALADVDMHAIQTSGNTIRNVTTDQFAGAALDEVADPRPYAELIRQWSTDHPEFQFLPRKFKIAITGGSDDRAVIRAHDIGLQLIEVQGRIAFKVFVGGGLGRTPIIGQQLHSELAAEDLLPYLEAVLSVYNVAGRRDNKYKARIKITVSEMGIDVFREKVEAAFERLRPAFTGQDLSVLGEIHADFESPSFLEKSQDVYFNALDSDTQFRTWVERNVNPHKHPSYASVTISLKGHGNTPGDASASQMRVMADLAERFGHEELRVSHEQNIVLPHVAQADLPEIYRQLGKHGLATANIGLVSDIIACPGMDYCALATARSIPIAQDIALRYERRESEIGDLKIKISGCINACGHHHVGHIGILGLDKAGVENYQITIGGSAGNDATIGRKMGRGFSVEELMPALDRLIDRYLALRVDPSEAFVSTVQRLGTTPFQEALYAIDKAA